MRHIIYCDLYWYQLDVNLRHMMTLYIGSYLNFQTHFRQRYILFHLFNFSLVSFPYLRSSIPLSPAYEVFFQLIDVRGHALCMNWQTSINILEISSFRKICGRYVVVIINYILHYKYNQAHSLNGSLVCTFVSAFLW